MRTVVLRSGPKGFGFTLGGERPCRLSTVHSGGVAAQAGLQARDRLLAVNGVSVIHWSHAEIASKIAACGTSFSLTVESSMTEPDWNLTDQSSIDSDTQVRREQKEKLEAQLHAARKKTADKSRTEWPRWAASSEWTIDRGDAKRPQSSATAAHPRSSSIKSRRSARSTSGSHSMWQIAPPAPACEPLTGVLSSPPSHGRPSQVKAKNANWQSAREGRRQMPGGLADRSASDPDLNGHSMLAHAGVADDSELQSSSTECGSDSDRTTEGISELMLFQCVLVYIGAVPVSNVEKTRRSIVKKAIHSLRLQHAKARTVLFQIFSDEIVVTNSRGAVTNRFKSRNVAFAAPCAENKQYFGVAHIAGNEDVVCHIFAADPQLHLHTFHYHYAKKFSIRCSKDPDSSFCLEFPHVSTPVLHSLAYMRQLPPLRSADSELNAPRGRERCGRRNYASSTNGSDSGIGGADGKPATFPRKCALVKSCSSTSNGGGLRVTWEEKERITTVAQVHHHLRQDQDAEAWSRADSHSSVDSRDYRPDMMPPTGARLRSSPAGPVKQQSCDLTGQESASSSPPLARTRSQQDVLQLGAGSSSRKLSASQPDFGSSGASGCVGAAQSTATAATGSLSRSSDQMLAASTGADVERILQHPEGRKPFQHFLEQQFCSENLNFYLAVEDYRRVSDVERPTAAKSIYERHFTANSVEPVNIDNSTAKTIKEAVMGCHFTAELYDVAQYQIFHLLKYDCWPRFLQWQAKNPTFAKQNAKLDCRSMNMPSATSAGSDLNASTGSLQHAEKREHKRKSLLWQGLRPRFSRRKKESSVPPPAAALKEEQQRDASGPAQCHSHQSTSAEHAQPAAISSSGSKRRQGFTAAGKQYSVPAEFAYSPQLSQASTSGSRPDVVPESEPPQASSPNRARNCDNVGATDRTERFCSLRTADGAFEKIALRDPQESVAKWTRTMAASRGLSTTGTEAVDDQTGVLIDPARQAMDALGNRSVRLEAAVLFRVELAASTSTERKLVAVKAKHGAPAGAVLRPVLTKYGVDLDKVVVCFAGSNEFLPHSESISKADKRKLIIMSPLEFQDYINTPRVDMLAQSCPTSSFNTPTPSPTADWTIPYHPLGDVCVAELPLDEAGSRSKHSAVRSLSSHAKSDHPSGLGGMLKFVRKASHSTKDDSVATTCDSRPSAQLRRKSLGTIRASVTSAFKSDPALPDATALLAKRQTITNPQELKHRLQQDKHLGELMNRAQASRIDDQRGTSPGCYELPDFLKTGPAALDLSGRIPTDEQAEALFARGHSPRMDVDSRENVSVVEVDGQQPNGRAQRLQRLGPAPPLYASSVRSDVTTPTDADMAGAWQVDYV